MYEKTILVVDDEPRTREGLKRMLEKWADGRYLILTASNGIDALERMKNDKIHILLTDIRMPELTGLQFLKKAKMFNSSVVSIIFSAYPEFDYAQQAIELGVVGYLVKPIEKRQLIETLETAIDLSIKNERADVMEKVMDDKLVRVLEKQTADHSPIQEAIQFIDRHLHQDLSLKNVADHIHLNPSYFSVLFKEQTEMTFSDYVMRRRMQRAKELLITTSLPISDVAEACGYKTTKYFIKVFKHYEGVTPNVYRKTQG
ncbi:response regulator transcription factor [Caenibacillus caldisaponilyticus]|uniref:response regulator transcription factor n=1 Tax=Caenibacillus caldisaponilyticus TaxID=1674942 RepID=UPI000988352B|nr:response regulator [Caenibacillus caldisaponilyticus]